METELKFLKKEIENFSNFHQIEILRILKENNVAINENKNGIFINLSNIENPICEKLKNYVSYVKKQENQLNELEDKKNILSNTFFNDNKDSEALYM